MDYNKLSELLFPHVDKTPADYEALYPPREEGKVITRLGAFSDGIHSFGQPLWSLCG